MLEVISKIAEQGIIGLVAALALFFAIYKDRQATAVLNENRELTKQLIDGYRGLAQDIAKLINNEGSDEPTKTERGATRDGSQHLATEATSSTATKEATEKKDS